MRAAQTLYEGVDIAGHGTMGLITYMRTDSLRISDEAVAAAREYIAGAYGESYICPYKRTWKTKSATAAQDAHEAIRPSVPGLTPDEVDKSISGDTAKLYRMIWSRFMASQMADCSRTPCLSPSMPAATVSRPAATRSPSTVSPPCTKRPPTRRKRRRPAFLPSRRVRCSSCGS